MCVRFVAVTLVAVTVAVAIVCVYVYVRFVVAAVVVDAAVDALKFFLEIFVLRINASGIYVVFSCHLSTPIGFEISGG